MDNIGTNKTFKFQLAARIYLIIFTIFISIFLIAVSTIPSSEPTMSIYIAAILHLLPIFGVPLAFMMTLSSFKYSLTITDYEIIETKIFSKRSIPLVEILGYKQIPVHNLEYKKITQLFGHNNKLLLSVNLILANKRELESWIFSSFTNLDKEPIKETIDDITKDVVDQYQKDELINTYNKLIKLTNILNTLCVLAILWLLAFPRPYLLAVAVNALLPIIAILLVLRHLEIMGFNEKADSQKTSIDLIIIACPAALAMKALKDFHIIYSSLFFEIFIGLSVFILILFLLILNSKPNQSKNIKKMMLGISIFVFFYCYSLLVFANCLFDFSKAEEFEAAILDKRIDSGKITYYYFEVPAWGPFDKESEISVPRSLYMNKDIGDKLYLNMKNGNFGFKWFIPLNK